MPTRQDESLGGVKEGAPLARGVFDPGILADASAYQPTKVAGSTELAMPALRPDGAAGGRAAVDIDAEVKAAVRDLVNALKDGEVELALRCFDPEHVRPLAEHAGTLLDTFDRIDRLRRFLEQRLGADDTRAEQLLGALRGADLGLTWDILDTEHASVSPNLAAVIFGPKATPTLQLARREGEWRYQLEGPLSDADVEAILTFHKELQRALDAVTDWVAATEKVEPAQLAELLAKALAGEPLELAVPEGDATPAAGHGTDRREREEGGDRPAGPRGRRQPG